MPYRGSIGVLDCGNIGLGDCLTALAVFRHLRLVESRLFSPECTLIVPDALGPLAAHLLGAADVKVRSRSDPRQPARGGQLILRAPKTLGELAASGLGRVIYLNWAEAHALAVSGPGAARGGPLKRLRFGLLELCQFKTIDWHATAPSYIGFRLLFPLFTRSSHTLTWHVVKMKASLPAIRASLRSYSLGLEAGGEGASPREPVGRVVIFPAAASFNAMPPELCRVLAQRFGDQVRFALHDKDPWLGQYQATLRNVVIVRTVEDTLGVLSRNYPVCVDGFVSHLVQLVKDEALILYTREPKERLTHPGAYPDILEAHPDCAPCSYTLRAQKTLCPADRPHCIAFDEMRDRLIAAIEAIVAAPARGPSSAV